MVGENEPLLLSSVKANSSLMACWLLLAAMLTTAPTAFGQVLVGDVFRTGFEGWTDVNGTHPTASDANWGVLLTGDKFLFEQSDGLLGAGTTTMVGNQPVADGKYTPYLMVNNAVTSPTHYTIDATLATVDDDGFGVVFGYVDEMNYFRSSTSKRQPWVPTRHLDSKSGGWRRYPDLLRYHPRPLHQRFGIRCADKG